MFDDFLRQVATAETSVDAAEIWREFREAGRDCPATKADAVDLWRRERDEQESALSM